MTSNDRAIFFTDNARSPAGYRQALLIDGEEYGFRWIPAGEFEMGSPESEEGRDDDETLHHVILTKGFWLLETPVTQRLYHSVVGTNPSSFSPARNLASQFGEFDSFDALLTRSMEIEIEMNLITSDLPVETVSYDEALKFCKELTKLLPKGLKATLPTEAQWEYACRAGTKTAYWYGNTADSNKMNYDDYIIDKTTPVKCYDPNAWGLYDMHGNVWEWCLDWYDEDHPSGTVTDPVGPNSGSSRVCRGGSWFDSARGCRSAYRGWYVPGDRNYDLGFRVLLVCD